MTFGFAFVEGKSLKTTIGGKGGKKYEIDSDIDEFRDLCDDLRKNKEKSIIILKGTFEFEKAEKSGDAVFKIPSNCTIYGEGCTIIGGFEIKDQENVIIQNIISNSLIETDFTRNSIAWLYIVRIMFG